MAKNNKTVVEQVKEKIAGYVADRERELTEIDAHITAAEADRATAEAAMKIAVEGTDQTGYNAAKAQIEAAQNVIDMFTERKAQLIGKEFLSEAESDATIDSLLAYKTDRDADLAAALAEECARIREIVDKYKGEYKDVYDTIRTWEEQIHANYRRLGVTYAPGNEPKDPAPVHIPQMHGAVTVCERFLNNVSRTY